MTARALIAEEFTSIQGEGSLVGTPSRFVRVAGCPLRCAWCDEPGSSWRPRGLLLPVDEVAARAAASGPRHAVLTGGEPFAHAASAPLSAALRAAGLHLTVETAGVALLPGLELDLASVSPKLAHSRPDGAHRSLLGRHERLRRQPATVAALLEAAPDWQLKFVVRPTALAADLDEVEALLRDVGVSAGDRRRVFLVPEGCDPATADAALRIVAPACLERGFRLGPRLHLTLYGDAPGT